ncbi:hypothetical protein MNBD_PLANCTO02-359 [hydrothermal vent metagenome]|uniref:Outer membrane protein H n=1 Tax=hydrothermal vent metagenome TaxID=652676 RepID=A0A3B1DY70_9ZZZZ
MKKQTLLAITFSVLVTTFITPVAVQAQESKSTPHRVGLVDVGLIFKQYEKLGDMQKALKSEFEQSDLKAKILTKQITDIQSKLKSNTLKKESPEYIRYERALVEKTNAFKSFRENLQREYLRKEAKMYKEIYSEVTQMVGHYARHYHYTLVIRFNRNGVKSGGSPQETMRKMNQLVIFHDSNVDITKSILKHLNEAYSKSKGIATGTRRIRKQ